MQPRYLLITLKEKNEVINKLKQLLTDQKDVIFAFIYGSFNDYTENLPFKDIDMGVYIKEFKKKESIYYAIDLSENLSSAINLPVDVRILNFAPVTFLFHVIQGELIINKDMNKTSEFMERVIRHYLDMKPLISRGLKEAFTS